MTTAPKPSNGWEEKQAFTIPVGQEKQAFTKQVSPAAEPKKAISGASGATVGKRISIANAEKVSIWARIAGNSYFENTTMGVITFNAMWIGIDTEWNHANMKDENGKLPLEPLSIIVENLFCVYFTMEVTIRFLAFKPKRDCIFDAWFVFDSVLVAFMILETWVMVVVAAIINSDSGSGVGPLSALRLLRLLRLARVGRLMRFVPELGKLVKGMVKAARSVVFILIFLVLVMYVFAIIFTGTFSDHVTYPLTPYCRDWTKHGLPVGPPPNGTEGSEGCLQDGEFGELGQDLFATMGDSIMTLFTRGVLGDNLDETVEAILDQSLVLMWLFFIFLIITFATLLNMLIGVVCEVISDAAAEEEENETVSNLKGTIQEAFFEIDENEDGLVCKEEWDNIKGNKNVRKSLASIGIDDARMEERLQQMQEMLFNDDDEGEDGDVDPANPKEERQGLTLHQLIQKVVDIRPDQNASALDLELLKAQVTKDQKNFMTKLRKIEEGVKQLLGAVAGGDDKGGGGGGQPDMPGMPPLPSMDDDDEDELQLEDIPTAMLFQCLKDRATPGFVEGTQAPNIIHR